MPSDDFVTAVQWAWTLVQNDADLQKRGLIANLEIIADDSPTEIHNKLVGIQPGHMLLAIWEGKNGLSRITLFEDNIRQVDNGNLQDTVYKVLSHEVWQHHMGTNHTARPTADKSLEPSHEFHAVGGRCCPDGSWGW